MSSQQKSKLSRRQFAGTVAAAVAAPVLLGEAFAQEEKKPQAPPAQAQAEDERTFLERGRQALHAVSVPAETEPAFVFQVETGGRHGR